MLVILAARNLVQLGIESSQETTILPPWVALVASPLLLVLASEVAVDWLKHGYIIRFNALSLNVYDSFSSVLCQDYSKYAFTSDNTRRLGMPVIPLACLFIRINLSFDAIQRWKAFVASFILLFCVKILLGFVLLSYTQQHSHTDPETTLARVNRYEMVAKRIW